MQGSSIYAALRNSGADLGHAPKTTNAQGRMLGRDACPLAFSTESP